MKRYLKKLKVSVAILLIVPFFPFNKTAYAATDPSADDATNIALCTTTAVMSAIGANAAAEGASIMPKTISQGLVSTTAKKGAASFAGGSIASAGSTAIAVPVADAVATEYIGTIAGINAAHASLQDLSKMNLDMLAYSVAQCALTEITNNTIAWIQGGFQGSPKFEVDTRTLFEDIAKGVASDFANQIRGLQSCDFTPNFIDNLANRVDVFPSLQKKPPNIKCPFPAQSILASDFYNAGSGVAGVFTWKLMETAISANGNQFNVERVTNEELAYRQEKAKANNDQKLGWSNGFVDILDTDPSKCNYPGDIYDPYLGWTSKSDPASGDYIGDAAMKFIQKESCPTTTPGKVVADSLMKALGAKQDRIGFADNMNKIISALIQELTSEAVHGIFKAANNATPSSGPSSNTSGSQVGTWAPSGTGALAGTIPSVTASTVSNGAISNKTSTSVTLNGDINFPGSPLTASFVWTTSATDILTPTGTATAPYTYNGDVTDPANPPSFSANLTGLTSNTTYYFRAVGVTDSGVTSYGAPLSFTTD